MKKILFFVCIIILANNNSYAQQRWYIYGDYFKANLGTSNTNVAAPYIWNDTTSKDLYSTTTGTNEYINNTLTSVGLSLDPQFTGWNNPVFFPDTMVVSPSDAYTIDSVIIKGIYERSFTTAAKRAVVDTMRVSLVYGNGNPAADLPLEYFGDMGSTSSFPYPDYYVDTLYTIIMRHDTVKNTARGATVQHIDILLHSTDTSANFIRSYPFPSFAVPAGNYASMSVTFISGDNTFTPGDTVFGTGASAANYKYGMFRPLVIYHGLAGYAAYPPYSDSDQDVGFFNVAGSPGWNGYYIPNWAFGAAAASYLQYPYFGFHVQCPTCRANNLITGPDSGCARSDYSFTFTSFAGGTWSSSNTYVATINASTGLATGINAGTTTITYTYGTSYITSTFTVLATPALISAPATSSCPGTSVVFTDMTAGGTWSSGSTYIASVSSTGTVTSRNSGTTDIYYTKGSCSAYITDTVKPLASAGTLTAPATICNGATAIITDAGAPGGTWGISNTTIASINSSGYVTGINPGTDTITYTVIGVCDTATAKATVNISTTTSAGVISGSTTVTTGSSITLVNTTASAPGAWSSSNTTIANVNPVTGVVTGITTGTVTITCSVDGCGGIKTTTITITVISHVSISNVAYLSAIITYPNPVNGKLNIGWNEPMTEKGTVVITDITGRELYKSMLNMTQGTGSSEVDLSGFAIGFYMISIKTNTISYNNKIQVQH